MLSIATLAGIDAEAQAPFAFPLSPLGFPLFYDVPSFNYQNSPPIQHQPSLTQPGLSVPPSSFEKNLSETDDKRENNDFYEILDKITESNEEEITRIKHSPSVDKKSGKAKYRCNICQHMSDFFTMAEKHHMNHEQEEFAPVRETLRRIEFERANHNKECCHITVHKS